MTALILGFVCTAVIATIGLMTMAVLTQDRDTERRRLDRRIVLLMEAATEIFAGSMVSVNAAGFAVPSTNTAGEFFRGRAEKAVNNTGAQGATKIVVSIGVFKWTNSAGSAIVQASIGDEVFCEDDNTVALVASNSLKVGRVDEIDDDGGIWVDSTGEQ